MQPVNETTTQPEAVPMTPAELVPEPSSAENPEIAQAMATFGAYGTQIFHGFITGEEYNPDLRGRFGIKIYDQMRKSDSTVKASLDILGLPIVGANYDVEPASDDPNDILIAEQLKWQIFERMNWRDFIREALTHLPFGFAVFEKVYEFDTWRGNADGQGAGTYLCISKLALRKADTIMAWELSDHKPGVRQNAPNATRQIEIPADKLLIYTHQREGANFEGISVLRSSYKNWFIKSQLEKIATIAAERQGVGVPYFKPPATAAEKDKEAARKAMRNLRANEQAYLEMPAEWELGMLEMKASQNFDVTPDIQYHDRQIFVNVLGQFLTIGGTGMSGSYAASSDQSQLLDLARMAVANTILDGFNNNVVKQWVDLNFNVNKYPKVTVSKIANDNLATLSDAVQKFKMAGLLTPDIELEEAVRKAANLPEMPEATKENYDAMHAAPVPGTDPNAPSDPNSNPDHLSQDNIGNKVNAVDGIRSFHTTLSKQIAAMDDDHGQR